MLRLNLLRVFHEVATRQSVVKASEALFISQPAISNALKKLQKDIEVRLFHKTGRNLTLTEHGETLLSMTVRLFKVENEIRDFLAELRSDAKQNIHVGLVTIYERFGIEQVIQYFSEIDPSLSVSIHSGNSKAVIEMLLTSSIDMGICGNVLVNSNLHYKPYKRHEIFLVAPRGHRLYGLKDFSADDIRGERMVLKETGSSVRHTMNAFFQQFAINPAVVMELSNIDSILNIAEREKCITFLPDMSISEKLSGDGKFTFARPMEAGIAFNTYVVWRKDGLYTETTRAIIEQFCSLGAKNDQPRFLTPLDSTGHCNAL